MIAKKFGITGFELYIRRGQPLEVTYAMNENVRAKLIKMQN